MRLGYVCQGGGALGWGHVRRGEAVLEAAGAGSALIVGEGFEEILAWSRTDGEFPVVPWRSSDAPADPEAYDVVVVDDYHVSGDWLSKTVRRRPVFVVDDWMRHRVDVTGLVNPNIGAAPTDYDGSSVQYWLMGSRFALIRRRIRDLVDATDRSTVQKEEIVLTLGGSDPDGRTGDVASLLTDLPWYQTGGSLTIVLGPSYQGAEPWSGWPASRTARVRVARHPADFASRCAAATLVVCGASTTTYELALLGRPFVPVAIVSNQTRVAREWLSAGVGPGVGVADPDWRARLQEGVMSLLTSRAERERVASIGRAAVDGEGARRLVEACSAAAADRR